MENSKAYNKTKNALSRAFTSFKSIKNDTMRNKKLDCYNRFNECLPKCETELEINLLRVAFYAEISQIDLQSFESGGVVCETGGGEFVFNKRK